MKKLFLLVVVCLLVVALHSPRVLANEVLKVTRDHFEFRDAPRVDDETFMGTLRIDTPVEWTGNVSGGWLEVKAPNGQIGWVHESGLSRPKTPVTQRTSPKPASSASRSTTQSSSAQVSKMQAEIKELKKTTSQYDAQLQKKDRRIQELSRELEDLEEKLSDTGQMLDDQEQLRTLNERKVTEAQNELAALQGTLKEKDEALLTAKVETTRLQNQLQSLQARQASSLSPERIVLALSLLLNLLGLLLFFMMRKRLSTAKDVSSTITREKGDGDQHVLETEKLETDPFDEDDAENFAEAGTETSELHAEDENDDRLKELDVVMTSPNSVDDDMAEEAIEEDLDTSDEVEIDLGDVLPSAVGVAAAVSNLESKEHEETEASVLPEDDVVVLADDVIIVEEPIERVDVPEEEIVVEALVEEHHETIPEDYEESSSELEELLELEEDDIDLEAEEVEELLLDKEELFGVEEDVSVPVDEGSDELVAESDMSEIPIEELEVSGETFEKLPKSATQIIESEDEGENSFDEKIVRPREDVSEENDDDVIIGNPGIIDEDDYENEAFGFESPPETMVEDFEPEEPDFSDEGITDDVSEELLLEAEDLEVEELLDTPGMHSEPAEFEVEEIVVIEEDDEDEEGGSKALHDKREERSREESRDMSLDVEELLEREAAESADGQKSAPSFLEPSPFLIEPEYETEELTASAEDVADDSDEEGGYDIELLDAGSNKDNVVHVLSKINGLLAAPKLLVESTPCLIAKGAGKNDAESFQLIMQKMGAKVRLIHQG